jgi:peroxidase
MHNKILLILAAVISSNTLFTSSIQAQTKMKRVVEGKVFQQAPRPPMPPTNTCPQGKYRTLDGTCNNIGPNRNEWGATDIALLRDMPAEYGASNRNGAMAGENRPSARAVSNLLSNEPVETFSKYGLSTLVYIWGQFLDHDITLTPTGTTESAPVTLPANEPLFTMPVPFKRSEVYAGTGVTNQRQQSNLNTAWIDASNVYGSETDRARWLRTLTDGKMKTSAGNLLPYNTTNGAFSSPIDPTAPTMTGDNGGTTKTFVAGDVRAAEHPGLTAMHTLFVREHNRICDRLKREGLRNDEEMYQRARKEVGALIQAITYQEFLPTFGITLSPYARYNPTIRPDITNIFATAAYRFGHSVVADDILLKDNQCRDVGEGKLDLLEVFFNPETVRTFNIDPILKGLASHQQYEMDLKVNSVLRNMLFGDPNSTVTFGLDLVSLNIQRGRDHGLPNYNKVRQFYTGNAARTFRDITAADSTAQRLQTLYKDVNNIDLWVGLLAEDQLPNKSVGKTLHALLKSQFESLRDGDFYFYLNDPFLDARTRDSVRRSTFADVIKRNTPITNLQTNVFIASECPEAVVNNATNAMMVARVKPNAFAVFPNPAQDILMITTGKNLGNAAQLEIFSADGKLIKTMKGIKDNETLMLNVNDYVQGTYFITLKYDGQVLTKQFTKL